MSLRLSYQFARRELRGGVRGFRIFIACLALGVMAIAAVGSVRSAINAGLERESAALLGGDAEVELTYRFANDTEIAWMNSIATTVSETVDFRSMLVVDRETPERGLTQVLAVDDTYPLIGTVQLEPEIPLDQALAGSNGRPGLIVEQILADRLAIGVGDIVKLGTQEFILSAILAKYPDNAGGGFGLGPRTIVLTDSLSNSGLLADGTLMETQYRLLLPEGTDLDALEAEADQKFRDTGMRWTDSRNGARGVERFVDRLGSFLVLIGLSGLAVGGVGVSAAVRSYLSRKTATIATFKSLGATQRTIFQTYFIQIGILSIIGITIGVIAGAAIPVLFAPIIAANLPIPAEFAIYPAPLVEAAIYGALTAAIFTLWPLAKSEQVRAAALFRGSFDDIDTRPSRGYLIAIFGLVVLLVGLSAWFTDAFRLTIWTAGGICFALSLLVVSAWLIRKIAGRLRRNISNRPALRLALASISAQGGETTSVVLSLGLGLAVLAGVGQIDGNLRSAISDELPSVAPSYFFVDIQPDQIDGFRARLDSDDAVTDYEAAPMLRGIITRINGQPASDVSDHWVVRGDRGITYGDQSPDGTTVTQGEWWPAGYDGPPQISFAAEEATEMGLVLGDELTVNILGRDITAEITSFREVDFSNAGMGFVMTMNPAALAGAPHSWISTVYANPEAEAQLLRDLAGSYPNITAIRVRDAIDQVMTVVAGIASATRYGALATLVTGFLVLIGAAASGERSRAYEAAILKTTGAERSMILSSFALRSALMGLAAGVVALCAGIAGGWAVTHFVMDASFTPIWSNAAMIVLAGTIVNLVAGLVFAARPLSVKPARLLRANE